MAVIIALHSLGQEENLPLIKKGMDYVHRNAHKLRDDEFETIGFELLLPMLLDEAAELGLSMPDHEFAHIRNLAQEKMSRIPEGWMYKGEAPLVHNLEFLANRVERDKLTDLLKINGSIGNSPSASAYAAQFIEHPDLDRYLNRVMEDSLDGGICNVKPFEIFETGWIYYNLLLAGIHLQEMRSGIEYLRRSWRPNGVGFSHSGLMPDADDSSVAMKVLGMWGEPVDTGYLEYYGSDRGFLTFPFERNPSISTNIHILDTLSESRLEEDSVKRRHILKFLYDSRVDNRFWKDKWHMSPYYATAHAIFSVRNLDSNLTEGALRWILETQRDDGSWGIFRGTPEETAYCVQALMLTDSYRIATFRLSLQKAVNFLMENHGSTKHPELWIGKGVYAPTQVIESSIISALFLWRKEGVAGG
jgi:halimadienyl-diphosphate synthase